MRWSCWMTYERACATRQPDFRQVKHIRHTYFTRLKHPHIELAHFRSSRFSSATCARPTDQTRQELAYNRADFQPIFHSENYAQHSISDDKLFRMCQRKALHSEFRAKISEQPNKLAMREAISFTWLHVKSNSFAWKWMGNIICIVWPQKREKKRMRRSGTEWLRIVWNNKTKCFFAIC